VPRNYSSRKKLASARHFTAAAIGSLLRKSSQCIIAASPPAEHPERRACEIIRCNSKTLQYLSEKATLKDCSAFRNLYWEELAGTKHETESNSKEKFDGRWRGEGLTAQMKFCF